MSDERLKVEFKSRTQKLVLITPCDGGLKLERFVGLDKKGEARIDQAEMDNPELTVEGLKEAVEEFRVE